MSYKLGSLFDGSGGFPLAGALCGIEPIWASEVEPYPIAVTKSRFPKLQHLGDISKINGAEIEPVDIITFGSPCQDLSVAGKRAGLKHEANGDDETTRSGLFMEAVRIIKEMREKTNGEYPRFAIWENVPGAFSSNKGEDFKVVLEELIKIIEPTATMPSVPQKGWNYADSYIGDGWSLAYRVLDAQYWGVPQRRRRIYLVTDFRGECTREILFEREGLRGYFTQGRTPWQTTPTDAQGSTGADDRERKEQDVVSCQWQAGAEASLCVGYNVSPSLSCTRVPAVSVPYTLKIRSGCEGGGKGVLVQEDKSATLATNNDQYLFQPTGFDRYNQCSTGEKCETLRTPGGGDNFPTVYYGVGADIYNLAVTGDKACALTAGEYGSTGTSPKVIIPQGFDAYNQALTGDKAKTLNAIASDADHVPCAIYGVAYSIGNGQLHDALCPSKELSKTLNCMDDPMKVCIQLDAPMCFSQQAYDEFIENEVSCTLKARGGTYGGGSETLVSERQTTAFGFDPSASRDVGTLFIEECGKTLTNGTCPGHHDGVVIKNTEKPHYIVRRLTPTECARLQGFADRWGEVDAVDKLSQKDYQFWLEVRKTYDAINGREPKDYTVKQMLTWYNKLHTDSAEYKMWGNGIALPTALYVLQGVADALSWEEYEN